MKLQDALGECTLSLLRMIASAHGIPATEDALRAELCSRLATRFAEHGYLSAYASALSPEEMHLLQTLRASGWRAKAFVVNRIFSGADRDRGTSGRASKPIVSLLQTGLVFRGYARIGGWRGEVFCVPDDVAISISDVVATPAPGTTLHLAPSLPVEPAPDHDPVYDTFCLLSHIQRSGLRLVRGELLQTDLVCIEREAGRASSSNGIHSQRWRFLLDLCLAGGWVRRRGTSLEATPRARLLLAGARSDVRARLVDRYLGNRGWSDLGRLGKVKQSIGSARIDEAAGRRLLLHRLQQLGADEWYEIAAYCDAVRSTDPDFLREDYSSLRWGILDAASGVELYGPDTWAVVEGEWLVSLLEGPLHWLDMVRLGTDGDGRVVAFKRHPSSVQPVPQSAPDSKKVSSLRIDEDLIVTVLRTEDLAGLYDLERYLEVDDFGAVRRYRLTQHSLLRALEAGGSLMELRQLLWRMGVTVPEAANTRLEEWAQEYGRFDIDIGLLLNLTSPQDADLLESLPGVAECIQTRLGPKTYLLIPETKERLIRALQAAGHPPRVHPPARALRPASSPPSPGCGGRGQGG